MNGRKIIRSSVTGWAAVRICVGSPQFFSAGMPWGVCDRVREKLARQNPALGLVRFSARNAGRAREYRLREDQVPSAPRDARKKDDAGSEWLAVLDLGSKFVEAGDIDAAQAEAFAGEWRIAPRIFARVGQVAITSAPGRKGLTVCGSW